MDDLETSEIPQTADEADKVINKRRSSVFLRRSIVPIRQDPDETISEDPKSQNVQIASKKPHEEPFDLSKYIKSLQREQEDWRKMLNERKSRRRALVREESRAREGVDFDLSVLTESKRTFIAERPNYRAMSGNIEKLANASVKAATLSVQVDSLEKALVQRYSEEIFRAEKQLIRLSDV